MTRLSSKEREVRARGFEVHALPRAQTYADAGRVPEAMVALSAAGAARSSEQGAALLDQLLQDRVLERAYLRCRTAVPEDGTERVTIAEAEAELSKAWGSGYPAVLALCRSLEISLDTQDQQGRTSLHQAADAGRVEHVVALLAAGARTDIVDAQGRTPLHLAAARGDFAVLEKLCPKSDLEALDAQGNSALRYAARGEDPRVAEVLLAAGAQIEAADPTSGNRALHEAAHSGQPQMLECLLRAKAEPNAQNEARKTALHLAVAREERAREIAKILLQAGADPNIRDIKGETPLREALYYPASQRPGLVELLLQREWGVDLNDISEGSLQTPLHRAIALYRAEDIGPLVQRGSSLTAQDAQGRSPLQLLAQLTTTQDHAMRDELFRIAPHLERPRSDARFSEPDRAALAQLRKPPAPPAPRRCDSFDGYDGY